MTPIGYIANWLQRQDARGHVDRQEFSELLGRAPRFYWMLVEAVPLPQITDDAWQFSNLSERQRYVEGIVGKGKFTALRLRSLIVDYRGDIRKLWGVK